MYSLLYFFVKIEEKRLSGIDVKTPSFQSVCKVNTLYFKKQEFSVKDGKVDL